MYKKSLLSHTQHFKFYIKKQYNFLPEPFDKIAVIIKSDGNINFISL